MDFSDVPPARYWIPSPEKHPEITTCDFCGEPLDLDHAVPVMEQQENVYAACPTCAPIQVRQHPITVQYMKWMETGDPRWWSPWMCNHCTEVDSAP